jgi:hypothetical protein
MLRTVRWMGTVGLAWLAVAAPIRAQGDISVNVYPSLAPNFFGSPSFTPWQDNAITALFNGVNSFGDPSLPTYYEQIPDGSIIPIWIATEFPSWHTRADPGAVFGPSFANELGNRLYFNLHVNGNGSTFSLSQLSFLAVSTDSSNFLGFSVPAGSYNYSSGFVGLNYGPDGMRGGGDDILITGGANTQLIHELFARGSGNAPSAMIPDPGNSDQEKIDNVLAEIETPFIFSGTFTLSTTGGDVNGNAFVVVGVPEPAAVAMAGLAATGLAWVCYPRLKKLRRRAASRRRTTATA